MPKPQPAEAPPMRTLESILQPPTYHANITSDSPYNSSRSKVRPSMSDDDWKAPPPPPGQALKPRKSVRRLFGFGRKTEEPAPMPVPKDAARGPQSRKCSETSTEGRKLVKEKVPFDNDERRIQDALKQPSRSKSRRDLKAKERERKPRASKSDPDMSRSTTRSNTALAVPTLTIDEVASRLEQATLKVQHRETRDNTLLGVTIPKSEMERYSVMFSQLLGESQANNGSTSELLKKRQATLERLKEVGDKIAELERKEQSLAGAPASGLGPRSPVRRSTSPGRSAFKGGILTLPPKSSSSNRSQPGSPGLHRSNTSPAALSPSHEQSSFPFTLTSPTLSHRTRPLQIPRHERTITEESLVASPTSSIGEETPLSTPIPIGTAVPLRPRIEDREPEWEMLAPASSRKGRGRANTTHGSRPPPVSSMNTPLPNLLPTRGQGSNSSKDSSNESQGSYSSAVSEASAATTISSTSHSGLGGNLRSASTRGAGRFDHMRPVPLAAPIPRIKVKPRPSGPYPSGITPHVPNAGPYPVRSSSARTSPASSTTTLPLPGTINADRSPRISNSSVQSGEVISIGMHIPTSRFATLSPSALNSTTTLHLPPPPPVGKAASVRTMDSEKEDDPEAMLKQAAEISIARQISISRQQSQLVRERLASRHRQRSKTVGESEKVEQKVVGGKGWMLKEYNPGLVPRVNTGENRKSECVVLEGN